MKTIDISLLADDTDEARDRLDAMLDTDPTGLRDLALLLITELNDERGSHAMTAGHFGDWMQDHGAQMADFRAFLRDLLDAPLDVESWAALRYRARKLLDGAS